MPLADIWPAARARRLSGLAFADRGQLLERIAEESLAGHEPDPIARAIAAQLRAGRPVASIAAAAELSERQLLRRCRHAFGYGPKTLTRILRFGRAGRPARWPRLAPAPPSPRSPSKPATPTSPTWPATSNPSPAFRSAVSCDAKGYEVFLAEVTWKRMPCMQ